MWKVLPYGEAAEVNAAWVESNIQYKSRGSDVKTFANSFSRVQWNRRRFSFSERSRFSKSNLDDDCLSKTA